MKKSNTGILEEEQLCPCHHMTTLISRRSDGTLTGPAKWYTDFHVRTCPQCQSALKGLRQVNAKVKKLSSDTPDSKMKLGEKEWKQVHSGWDDAEGKG
jgi:hypothetical protein